MTTKFVEGAIVVGDAAVRWVRDAWSVYSASHWKPVRASDLQSSIRCEQDLACGRLCGARYGTWLHRHSTASARASLSDHFALIGFLVGAAAMAAELPNSFLKRRLGISPGAQASGIRGLVFHIADQIDVVFGAWAVLACVELEPGRASADRS